MLEGKKTILLVEDEKSLTEAVKTKLEILGFDVVSARSVDQAVSYLEDIKNIDLVWLDHYLLGKENGLDLVIKMKAEDSKWKKIPIFIISNTASPDKINSYLHLGVEKYFTKADNRLDNIIKDINSVLSKDT